MRTARGPALALLALVLSAHVADAQSALRLESPTTQKADPRQDVTILLRAERLCAEDPTLTFEALDGAFGIKAQTVEWGDCDPGKRFLQLASANLTLPADPWRGAGTHNVTFIARTESALARNATRLVVPLAPTILLGGRFHPQAPQEGGRVTVEVTVNVSTNGPLTLRATGPAGWTAHSPQTLNVSATGAPQSRVFTYSRSDVPAGDLPTVFRVVAEGKDADGARTFELGWSGKAVVAAAAVPGTGPDLIWILVLLAVVGVGATLALGGWLVARGLAVKAARAQAERAAEETRARAQQEALRMRHQTSPGVVRRFGDEARPEALPPPRFLNLCFARPNGEALPRDQSLAIGQAYALRVDIGDVSPQTLVVDPRANPFPEEALPPDEVGHWIDVVAVSDEVRMGAPAKRLFLPKKGPSFACDCARLPHTCGERGTRGRWLLVPLLAPPRPGDARVRVGVYHRNNLLQSNLVQARVERREKRAPPATARVDYRLTAGFQALDRLPAKDLNILMNHNGGKTHRLVFKGDEGEVGPPAKLNLTEGQMRSAVEAARAALAGTHAEWRRRWGVFGARERRSLLDGRNGKTKEAFQEDLKTLANLGADLFDGLFQDLGDERPLLRERLRAHPLRIQVSRMDSTTFVFPWALVYDGTLDKDPKGWRFCPLVERWDGASPLVGDRSECPHATEHGHNVLCPFRFWGFRHRIEEPPSAAPGGDLVTRIASAPGGPRIVAVLSRRLDPDVTRSHLTRLRDGAKADLVVAEDLAGASQLLRTRGLEVAYFYCHGARERLQGETGHRPLLLVGDDDRLGPRDVRNWRDFAPDHWQDPSPLVFINGCHTAELTPEMLVDFVRAFSHARAAGVVGTEVALLQPVASEVAEAFFASFGQRKAGEAMLAARRRLLDKGNLLGLAYTLYASSELELVVPR